jgi:hypothetical protein
MATCRRGYRAYLDELRRADVERTKEAFECIKKGNAQRILELLKEYPGLLIQPAPEGHRANVIISALYHIANPHGKIRKELIKLLKEIVKHYKDKIDLKIRDSDGNTALHRVFWYAIRVDDDQISAALTNIGCAFISLIKSATEFREIMALQNAHKESFLNNIYLDMNKVNLKPYQLTHLESVQKAVAKHINPYKRKLPEQVAVPAVVDFNEKSFKDRLEALLTDPVSFELMENPVIFKLEGHTLDQTTWARTNPRKNPLTQTPFKEEQLAVNHTIKTIINLFKTYSDQERKLAEEIQKYLDGSSIHHPLAITDQFAVEDYLTMHIKELLRSYQHSLILVPAAEDPAKTVVHRTQLPPQVVKPKRSPILEESPQPQETLRIPENRNLQTNEPDPAPRLTDAPLRRLPPNANIPQQVILPVVNPPPPVNDLGGNNLAVANGQQENTVPEKNKQIQSLIKELVDNIRFKKNKRATWFKQNSEEKLEKLQLIHDWVGNYEFNEEIEKIVMAVIRDVCAIKRNKLGFFAPHSLDEFKIRVVELELNCSNNVHFTTKALNSLNSQDAVLYLVCLARDKMQDQVVEEGNNSFDRT